MMSCRIVENTTTTVIVDIIVNVLPHLLFLVMNGKIYVLMRMRVVSTTCVTVASIIIDIIIAIVIAIVVSIAVAITI